MIWDPVFSPDGEIVAARAAQGKEFFLVMNGKIVISWLSITFRNRFSAPDGSELLLKAIESEDYRKVIPVKQLLGSTE